MHTATEAIFLAFFEVVSKSTTGTQRVYKKTLYWTTNLKHWIWIINDSYLNYFSVRLLKPSSVLQVLAWAFHYVHSCDQILPSAPSLSHLSEEEKTKIAPLLRSHSLRSPLKVDYKTKLYNKWMRKNKSESVCCSSVFKQVCSHNPRPRKYIKSFQSLGGCPSDPTFSCRELVLLCLAHIDANGLAVLCSQMLESLSITVLSLVLSRDSLILPSETLIIDALYRWSNAECRRQHKPLTLTSRRSVLGSMLTLPRLFTMTGKEVDKMRELYDSDEITYVRARLKKEHEKLPVPATFASSLNYLSTIRSPRLNKKSNSMTLCRGKREILMDMFALIALVIDWTNFAT